MPSDLNKVINSFPHPTIQLILGQPTYETIAEVHLKLSTNVMSVHLHMRNGKLGLLFLTIATVVYNT